MHGEITQYSNPLFYYFKVMSLMDVCYLPFLSFSYYSSSSDHILLRL